MRLTNPLGLKSGLAYSDSFSIITRFDGVEYTYVMYKGEDGTKIDLMRDVVTTEPNGTTVQIQLKSSYDKLEFTRKIKEQLCYFEGVLFEVEGIDNGFTILKNADWKYSSLNQDTRVHLCLNNVYYSIDWGRLGVEPVNLPIGLAFEVGEGLIPTPSREDIKYTEEAKELIKIRLAGLADYIVGRYNAGVSKKKEWSEIYKSFENEIYVLTEGGLNLPLKLDDIKKYSYLQVALPSLEGIEILDLKALSKKTQEMFANYYIRGCIRHSGTFSSKHENDIRDMIVKAPTLILTDHKPKGLELEYLKDKAGACEFVYKRGDKRLGHLWSGWRNENPNTYISLLNLKKLPRDKWRQAIKEYQGIEASIISKVRRITDLQPTQEWLEERRAERVRFRRPPLPEGKIILKIGRQAQRGDKNLIFEASEVDLRTALNLPYVNIYGTKEDEERMQPLNKIMFSPKKRKKRRAFIQFVILHKKDIKKIEGMHNFISIGEFMEGKTKVFRRIATASVIARLIKENTKIFDSLELVKELSEDFASKLKTLQDYEDEHNPGGSLGVIKEITVVAEEYNLWDYSIYNTYKEAREQIKIFDFIELLSQNRGGGTTSLCREILKGRKFKMNWPNYVPPPVDPPVEVEEEDVLKEIEEEVAFVESDIPF